MQTVIILDGTEMKNKKVMFKYIAKALNFPAYFGQNLDALADCLSECVHDKVIILINRKALDKRLDNYGDRVVKIFNVIQQQTNNYKFIIGY